MSINYVNPFDITDKGYYYYDMLDMYVINTHLFFNITLYREEWNVLIDYIIKELNPPLNGLNKEFLKIEDIRVINNNISISYRVYYYHSNIINFPISIIDDIKRQCKRNRTINNILQ